MISPITSYRSIPFPCWIHVIDGDWHYVKDEKEISPGDVCDSCDYYSTNSESDRPRDQLGQRLLTAHEWCDLYEIQIIDPDGWRGAGPTLDTRITKSDFHSRLNISTIAYKSPDERSFAR